MDAMYSKAAEFLAAVRGRVTVLDLDLEPSKAKEGSARMSIIYYEKSCPLPPVNAQSTREIN
jgi:hypothetical protein